MKGSRGAHFALPMLLAAMAMASASPAGAQGRSKFDHLRTMFPLTGVHAITPCETCHVGGQMAGTPTRCDYCHRPGSRIATTFKSPNHIQTNDACDNCHRSTATWSGARYSHVSVTPGTCFTCHNGSTAAGKPANHVMTTSSCDTCHRTLAWVPAGFNHASVAPGTCASCHNGTTATGKPANHVPTTAACDACHTTKAWRPAGFNHAGVAPGSCETCHRPGGSGLAAPSNHVPYKLNLLGGASMSCDACHTSTTTFTAQTMNHNGSQGNGSGWCKGCHLTGTSYLGNMQKRALTHQSSAGVTDCSQSGCHRPLGTQGTAYRSW
jgi:hypothetical protein